MEGCTSLGLLYQSAQGVTQDLGRARTLFEKACDGGAMEGCYNLGFLYEEAAGVAEDLGRARALFEKACNGGSMEGCASLGLFYRIGLGGAQDYSVARVYYNKACDAGIRSACISLQAPDNADVASKPDDFAVGQAYERSGDYPLAFSAYNRAGQAGNAEAFRRIAALYAKGKLGLASSPAAEEEQVCVLEQQSSRSRTI